MTSVMVLILFVVFVVACLGVIVYRDGKARYERMQRQVRDDLARPNPRGDLR